MQTSLQDHPKRCKECGNVARARSEWRIEKRGEDGLHFVHTCPECGTEDDVFLDLTSEHERFRGEERLCATYHSVLIRTSGCHYVTGVS